MEILRSAWLWLFPLSYLVHLAEEAWAGERFYRWIARVLGRPMSLRAWIGLNLLFLSAMCVVIWRVRSSAAPLWLVPGLATIVTINACTHLISGRITRTYSPGLWSGLLLWLPLGLATLGVSAERLPGGSWWRGVGSGILVHGIVVLCAFTATRLSARA
jgi:hypothetical protein